MVSTNPPLPEGFHDLLPPLADHEAQIAEKLMRYFYLCGYERIKPPLAEQQATDDGIQAIQRMHFTSANAEELMWLRHDITPQAMRLARSKLAHKARPLRLSYCGECLAVRSSQIHPSRQYLQAGIELFGAPELEAENEVILNGIEALRCASDEKITLDLNLPILTQALFDHADITPKERLTLSSILNRKDQSSLKSHPNAAKTILLELLKASGPIAQSVKDLTRINMPSPATKELRDMFISTATAIQKADPQLAITLDPLDNRGLVGYSGITFSIFMEGHRSEIGRGGRYETHWAQTSPQRLFARHHKDDHNHLYAQHKKNQPPEQAPPAQTKSDGESAVGLTIFIDALASATQPATPPKRIFAPQGTPQSLIKKWRTKGTIVINGNTNAKKDIKSAAAALACTHYFHNDEPVPLAKK